MKKGICFLLTLLMAISVCACAGEKAPDREQSGVPESGASSFSESSPEGETSLLLAQLQEANESLQQEIEKQEKQTEQLQNQFNSLQSQRVDYAFVFYNRTLSDQGKSSDMRILKTHESAYDDKMYLVYPDGSKELLYEGHHVLQPEPSPDGTKLLINDFVPAAGGSIWIYDVDTRDKKETAISASMKEDYAPAFMSWLDDRYFLFVEFFIGGSSTYGGDLCVYDTKTDHFFKLISCTQFDMEICAISVQSKINSAFFQYDEDEPSLVLFQVAVFDQAYALEQYRYAVLPAETLYVAIQEQKELKFTNNMFL